MKAKLIDSVSALKNRLRSVGKRKAPAGKAGPPIVLIHGINVPALMMWLLKRRLEKQYRRPAILLKYDWFFHDVPRTAEAIARQIRALGLKEYDCVTHSMGGVVFRWMLANNEVQAPRRVVMISPPNAGSWLAEYLYNRFGLLFELIYGQAGMQLRPGAKGIAARAGRLVGTEVGVIAGGSGTPQGKRNWFNIPGDCDGTVAVAETIVPGMKDFMLLNCDHTRILFNSQTAHMINLFLEHGVFRPGGIGKGAH